ncbi:Fbd-associated f-box protein [Thalictrum thalictroides]|uniref:Fbd-associated f-box protein n=1 Tax=Thalictrum thalictroides TaxID=46969 RepID=A0A7J6VZV7_THATH|nr:Fbd-associated f-box protein [Thalictrum thalictroides]
MVVNSLQFLKKKKLLDEEDRISNLPEPILHHILSFLPTKDAVLTSTLATTWRYLWKSYNSIDICDWESMNGGDKVNGKMTLSQFVNRVLLLSDVSNISKFSLKCTECDPDYFDNWISTVISRNVQEIVISIVLKNRYVFPHCLFTSGSLRILKIEFVMGVSIKIPASVLFSSLKVLHFKNIAFSCEESMQEVSFNCSILDELFIYQCTWLDIKVVNIHAPTLQMLVILDRWDIDSVDCEIKIYAESLTSLRFTSHLPYKYSLCHLSSVVNAYIDVHSSQPVSTVLGKMISNVKNLEMSNRSFETLVGQGISDMFTFSELIHLSFLYISKDRVLSAEQLIDMLYCMPIIRSLSFPDGLCFVGFDQIVSTTLESFLSHLKSVDIHTFPGNENELGFVKFLLKSARVLEKITIDLTCRKRYRLEKKYHKWGHVKEEDRIVQDDKKRITEQLHRLAKFSNCKLEIKGNLFGSFYYDSE